MYVNPIFYSFIFILSYFIFILSHFIIYLFIYFNKNNKKKLWWKMNEMEKKWNE
jgi:hypothetical protein